MAFSSSIIVFLFGTLIGLLVAFNDFPGKRIVVTFMRTLMGLPPVVVGIIVYVLFSGTGPFGNLGLIYSVKQNSTHHLNIDGEDIFLPSLSDKPMKIVFKIRHRLF